jgi:hypothetical protein
MAGLTLAEWAELRAAGDTTYSVGTFPRMAGFGALDDAIKAAAEIAAHGTAPTVLEWDGTKGRVRECDPEGWEIEA